jgi:Histidine kinase-, DNA gyrase B-, and HSP90-like ATPase
LASEHGASLVLVLITCGQVCGCDPAFICVSALRVRCCGRSCRYLVAHFGYPTLDNWCPSGIGIDENLKKDLFTPFRQGNSQARKAGLGLGLAIVKRLVELHGGTIEARSDGRGKGSTFLIRLPISTQGAIAVGE